MVLPFGGLYRQLLLTRLAIQSLVAWVFASVVFLSGGLPQVAPVRRIPRAVCRYLGIVIGHLVAFNSSMGRCSS